MCSFEEIGPRNTQNSRKESGGGVLDRVDMIYRKRAMCGFEEIGPGNTQNSRKESGEDRSLDRVDMICRSDRKENFDRAKG